jgi:hypothetical protein
MKPHRHICFTAVMTQPSTVAALLQYHDETDWMTKYFFSGGTMPSLDLLLYFQQHLQLQQQWWVNGRHYQETLEAWLANQDKFRRPVQTIFAQVGLRVPGRKHWQTSRPAQPPPPRDPLHVQANMCYRETLAMMPMHLSYDDGTMC